MSEVSTFDLSITARGPVTVAVGNAPPAYRFGLLSALKACGCRTADPDDILEWANEQERCVVLLVLGDETACQQLEPFTRLPGAHVVALLDRPTRVAAASAIRAGADGVVAWDSSTSQLVTTVTAAASGFVMMPTDLARQLVEVGPLADDPLAHLPDEHVSWLRQLARGRTVTALAKEAGYSERAMHRLLRNLYRGLGVNGRSGALVLLARCGALDATPP